jgi:hypothetical protein
VNAPATKTEPRDPIVHEPCAVLDCPTCGGPALRRNGDSFEAPPDSYYDATSVGSADVLGSICDELRACFRPRDPIALPEALLAAIPDLDSVQWFAADGWMPTCECDAPCCDGVDGSEYWSLAGMPCCSLECAALRLLWKHHPTQDQSDRAVDAVLGVIAQHIAECIEHANEVAETPGPVEDPRPDYAPDALGRW